MLFIIIGLGLSVGGYFLSNYLLNETIKWIGFFIGGILVGFGASRSKKVMDIANETEKQIADLEAKIMAIRARARANRPNQG